MSTRIAIAVFAGAEELDFVGPWEVLAAWRDHGPADVDVEVVLVGESTEPVTCAKGLRVIPHTSWEDLGDIDVLVYPGGRGTRTQLGDETIRARLRGLRNAGRCRRASAPGRSSTPTPACSTDDPRRPTGAAFEELLRLGHDIDPKPDARFVDDGEVVTAAGVSAGIDMALHLVGRLGSPEQARDVRRYIQYDPQPPY